MCSALIHQHISLNGILDSAAVRSAFSEYIAPALRSGIAANMANRPVMNELISHPYRKMQKRLHKGRRAYGQNGDKWAGIVLQLAIEYDADSILDYGAGRGTLAAVLRSRDIGGIRIDEYDPAIPGKDALPTCADLVNVTDVLEHIEPDRLDAVLQHIKGLAKKVIWVVVATIPSYRMLADGRDAHLTIQPGKWWKHRLRMAGFTLHPPPTVVRSVPKKEWCVVLTP